MIQKINTFAASNAVKLFIVVVFGKDGIDDDCNDGDIEAVDIAAMLIGMGDVALGIISFLLPGGINSGGRILGIAYFSNALYTRCIAYIVIIKSICIIHVIVYKCTYCIENKLLVIHIVTKNICCLLIRYLYYYHCCCCCRYYYIYNIST